MIANQDETYLYKQDLKIPLNSQLQTQQISFLKPTHITNMSSSEQKTTNSQPSAPFQKKNFKNFLNRLNRQGSSQENNENDFTLQDSITDENPNVEYKVQELNNNQTSNFTKFESFKNKAEQPCLKINQQQSNNITPIKRARLAGQDTTQNKKQTQNSQVPLIKENDKKIINIVNHNKQQQIQGTLNNEEQIIIISDKVDIHKGEIDQTKLMTPHKIILSNPNENQNLLFRVTQQGPLSQINQNQIQNQLNFTNQSFIRQPVQNMQNQQNQQIQNQINQYSCQPIHGHNYQSFQIHPSQNIQSQSYSSIPVQIQKITENNMISYQNQQIFKTPIICSPLQSKTNISHKKNNIKSDLYKSLTKDLKSETNEKDKQIQNMVNQNELQKSQIILKQSQNQMFKQSEQNILSTNDQPQSPIKLIGQKGQTVEGGIITGYSPILVQTDNCTSFSNSYTFTQNNFIPHSKHALVPAQNPTSLSQVQQNQHLNQNCQQISNEQQQKLEKEQQQLQHQQQQLQQEYFQLQQQQQYLQKEQQQIQMEQQKMYLQHRSNFQMNQKQNSEQKGSNTQDQIQNNLCEKRSYSIGDLGQVKTDRSILQNNIDSNIYKNDQIIKQKPQCSYFNTEKFNTLSSFDIKQTCNTQETQNLVKNFIPSLSNSLSIPCKSQNNHIMSKNNIMGFQSNNSLFLNNSMSNNNSYNVMNTKQSEQVENPINKIKSKSKLISQQKLSNSIAPQTTSIDNKIAVQNCELISKGTMNFQNMIFSLLQNEEEYVKQTKNTYQKYDQPYVTISTNPNQLQGETNPSLTTAMSVTLANSLPISHAVQIKNNNYQQNTPNIDLNDQNLFSLSAQKHTSNIQTQQIQLQQYQVNKPLNNSHIFTQARSISIFGNGKYQIQKDRSSPINISPLQDKSARFLSCQKYSQSNLVNQTSDKSVQKLMQKQTPTSGLNRDSSVNTFKNNQGMDNKKIKNSFVQKNNLRKQFSHENNRNNSTHQEEKFHPTQHDSPIKSVKTYTQFNTHKSPDSNIQQDMYHIRYASPTINTNTSINRSTSQLSNQKQDQLQSQNQQLQQQQNKMVISSQANVKQIQKQLNIIQQTPYSQANKINSYGLKDDYLNQQDQQTNQIYLNTQPILNSSQKVTDNLLNTKNTTHHQIDKRGKPPQQSIDTVNIKKDIIKSTIQIMRINQRSQSITSSGGNMIYLK